MTKTTHVDEIKKYVDEGQRSILIVEDEQSNEMVLDQILGPYYNIYHAGTGLAALELVRRHAQELSLIMLDLVLPEMDGTEILRQIKEDPTTQDIPVIVMTSQTNQEGKMLELGASDFIAKPYTSPAVIRARVSNIVKMYQSVSVINADIYDSITGLLSMRRFLDVVEEAKRDIIEMDREVERAVVYFNLTNFKVYNAKYGIAAGDARLQDVAQILREVFPEQAISRFSDDHFVVFAYTQNLENKLEIVHHRIHQIGEDANLHIKAGVRYFKRGEDDDKSPSASCDEAKVACDSVKHTSEFYGVYDASMGAKIRLRSHIVENLDRAIANGYIKLYYQPVIRAATGKICGMEALTRWIDPEYGFLSPGEFIPVLEETHLIHKLDQFVIEEAARQIRYEEDHGMKVIPISFNISRVDFIDGDPFQSVEEAVKKYGIRRDSLKCEITESTLMADKFRVSEELSKFRERGYEIWMDDFGSGYSSLNILKEFQFDELKIDMLFLRNLNSQGKRILISIVRMAKALGVHTLAEGAETKEQVEFLTRIGCERIQGYYFGKPMPFHELAEHCRARGIQAEHEIERQVLDQAGHEDLNTDVPTALFMEDGETVQPLIVNRSFMNVLASVGTNSLEQMMEDLNSPYYTMMSKFDSFFDKAIQSGMEETMTFVEQGQYLRLTAKTLSGFGNLHVHRVVLQNITYNMDEKLSHEFDALLRNISLVFTNIYVWKVKDDVKRVLETTHSWEKAGDNIQGARDHFRHYAEEFLYVDDKERFLEFMEPEHLYAAIAEGNHKFVSECFRVRQPNGNYNWIEFTAKVIVKSSGGDLLLLMREVDIGNPIYREILCGSQMETEDLMDDLGASSPLWANLMANSEIRYFWKDKDRRFLGASQAFLDAYGMESIDPILGKTDEEVGWHIDDDPYKNDELDVIHRGRKIRDSIGQNIINGTSRQISATKIPIYRNGKIEGLLGYFVDTEAMNVRIRGWEQTQFEDPITGLLNYRGATDAVLRFEDKYYKSGQDYMAVMMEIPEYERFNRNYGEEAGNELLRLVAERLRAHNAMEAVLIRLQRGQFLILDKMLDTEKGMSQMQEFGEDVSNIHKVGTLKATVTVKFARVQRSELASTDALVPYLMKQLD